MIGRLEMKIPKGFVPDDKEYLKKKSKEFLEEALLKYNLGCCVPVRVSASDAPIPLYFLAVDIEAAIGKAKLMSYQVTGAEYVSADEVEKSKYFKQGAEWARNHEPAGDPTSDAYWINSYDDA